MRVAIIDKNPVVREYFTILLKEFAEVDSFEKEVVLDDYDFVFIGEKINYKPKSFVVFLSLKDEVINEADYVMRKDISPLLFKKIFPVLIKLKELLNSQEELIHYKEKQEMIAIKKQMKFIKNTLMMFYEDDYLVETIFKPMDILSGDAIVSRRLGKKEYVFVIIDAMGKGVGASLTSTNLSSYLYYLINNFEISFEKTLELFTDYARSVLLDNEILSFIAVCVKNDKLLVANFGMPPIYIDREKYRANNRCITPFKKEKIEILTTTFKESILFFSDGLIESETKDGGIYFQKFKKILKDFNFLNELFKDFKKNAKQGDDVSIVFLRKEDEKKEIFNRWYRIEDDKSIMAILEEFDKFGDRVVFILNELLLNTYEHVVLKIKNKEEYIKRNEVIVKEDSCEDGCVFANIKIFENERFFIIEYCDSGDGFDLMILTDLEDRKYHARGIKMIKSISDGVFFNEKGNCIKIYLKKDKINNEN